MGGALALYKTSMSGVYLTLYLPSAGARELWLLFRALCLKNERLFWCPAHIKDFLPVDLGRNLWFCASKEHFLTGSGEQIPTDRRRTLMVPVIFMNSKSTHQ
ncbi:hypothetical protein F2P79_008573 [Pimephales promelas]|nr:hypothetical protein F2P79_008573 [Pimephales promelas]